MNVLMNNNMLYYQGGPIREVYYGLPQTCEIIKRNIKAL